MSKIPSPLHPPRLIRHLSFLQTQFGLAAFINWEAILATTISLALLIPCLLLLHPLSCKVVGRRTGLLESKAQGAWLFRGMQLEHLWVTLSLGGSWEKGNDQSGELNLSQIKELGAWLATFWAPCSLPSSFWEQGSRHSLLAKGVTAGSAGERGRCGLAWTGINHREVLHEGKAVSSQQYQIALDFCLVFLFHKSFSRGGHRSFAHYKFVCGGRAVIVMHASCQRGGGVKTERKAQRKGSKWPYLNFFHLTTFLEPWYFHLGGSSSEHSVWNKQLSSSSSTSQTKSHDQKWGHRSYKWGHELDRNEVVYSSIWGRKPVRSVMFSICLSPVVGYFSEAPARGAQWSSIYM